MNVSGQIEFSEFYLLLDSIKKGDKDKISILNQALQEFSKGNKAKSYLEELGQLYLAIGVKELYRYTNEKDISKIGSIEKDAWDELSSKNDSPLPQFLANAMVKHVKENQISKKIADKWSTREGEVKKHITKMARYVTEGILDVLE